MLRVATRSSTYAVWQSEFAAKLVDTNYELVHVKTLGDIQPDVPISKLSGRGVFVKEVQNAVLDGHADIAVHSAKDLPSSFAPDGITIGCYLPRGDARDVLVGKPLADLPTGGRIATGSIRRRAQLAALRPDLTFEELRGNIERRLERSRDVDAIVMAAVALNRLGLDGEIAQVLETDQMVPQVGQGAIAIECRADDVETLAALSKVDDKKTRIEVESERSMLARFGGGCDMPIGANAIAIDDVNVTLTGLLATDDGANLYRHTETGPSLEVGIKVAQLLMDESGQSWER